MLEHAAAASLPLWRSTVEHGVVASLELQHAGEDRRGRRHAPAWCTRRLLSKSGSDHRAFVVEAGVVPMLVPLLNSPDAGLQLNAASGAAGGHPPYTAAMVVVKRCTNANPDGT
ncbi:hypothetical protein QYE76_051878 [Lolium multiflorum]|uniref:Uncharacterized protein n=1 Tax=Lolium multiflorum TaxID=4521 RepID=A0AAD8STV9_LOLMU|nr:hypothetical protein QYE76_051878 [Lolium multiflorum]